MAWLIDGNKLKEKAVSLFFPSKMELRGHLPEPVQAVTVSEIEGMLYREGMEVVRCKDCKHWKDIVSGCTDHVKCCEIGFYMVGENGYCVYGEKEA